MGRVTIRELEDPLAGAAGSRAELIGARRDWIAARLHEHDRKEPLRVLIGSNTLTCGGAEQQILRLMPRLLELGFEVEHFYHGGPHYLKPRFEAKGLTSHYLDLHAMGRWRFIGEATALIRSRRYDIAHAFVGTANLYTRWAAMRAGVPVIIGGWRSRHPARASLLRMMFSFLNRWTGAWIINSPTNAEVLEGFAGREALRAYVVPNAFEFEDETYGRPPPLHAGIADWIGGRHAVVTLGRVEEVKNYDLFIDTAASITSRRDDTCFVLIASTDHTEESQALEQRLRKRIEEEGLSSRVLFTGRIDNAAALLTNFSLFLFTSETEGCPNAVIEAMAAGLPVVMTRSTDTGPLVEEGANGYTTGASSDELARHIETLLDDGERRRRFGEHSRELARRNFDAPNSAWVLTRIYLDEWERVQAQAPKER